MSASRLLRLLLLVSPALSRLPRVQIITLCVGGKNPGIGYEVMGAAVDIAMDRARLLYPKVFSSITRVNHFVGGSFTCAEAQAETTASLSLLIGCNQTTKVCDNTRRGLTIILAPG